MPITTDTCSLDTPPVLLDGEMERSARDDRERMSRTGDEFEDRLEEGMIWSEATVVKEAVHRFERRTERRGRAERGMIERMEAMVVMDGG